MEILLRRYFWVLNLLTITLCAFFAAKAVGHLVESKLPDTKKAKSSALPALSETGLEGPKTRDVQGILARNVFCSACEKVVETVTTKTGGADGEEATSTEAVKTSLNLQLIATLVSEDDKAWSYAAVMDPTDQKTRLFAIGSKLTSEATVTDIMDRRVLLLNGARNEYLDLATEASAKEAKAGQDKEITAMQPGGNPALDEVTKGIRKVGEGKYEIDRSALNKVLANTTILARAARIVPSVENGVPNGFRLYAIRPGSVYSMLGFFNGDTVNAINGHTINTPDQALEIYTKLRNANHLSISYSRRGATVSHEYTIR
jgi:general secretion pathway protein C